MDDSKILIQIRNSLYVLIALSAITLVVGVILNVYITKYLAEESRRLTDYSLDEMRSHYGEVEEDLVSEYDDLIEKGELEELVSRCEALLAERPLSPTGHFYLGVAHFHLGNKKLAEKSLREAKSIAPAWKSSTDPYLEALLEK
ncbi:MAG: hypothetical protein P1U58_07565 [Verrucomicrobiales bacterium]|nr:hypothetical protein [Verrucomicrobiales bacterium]